MSYFKNEERLVEKLNEMARMAVCAIAPTLSEVYCDASAEELIEIWDRSILDIEEEAREDFNPAVGRIKKFDFFYADRLAAEIGGFVAIAMENDW